MDYNHTNPGSVPANLSLPTHPSEAVPPSHISCRVTETQHTCAMTPDMCTAVDSNQPDYLTHQGFSDPPPPPPL